MQSETSAAPSATLPKIITVFNQKGGCAKTMTTMQVAGTLAHRGLKVLVADVDPQNTSTLWSMTADEGRQRQFVAPTRETGRWSTHRPPQTRETTNSDRRWVFVRNKAKVSNPK